MIRVRLFGGLKDRAGRAELSVPWSGSGSLSELWKILDREAPGVAVAIRKGTFAVAVNDELASDRTEIHDGDEVGLLPPFSGGVGEIPGSEQCSGVRIQKEDFSVDDEIRRVKSESKRVGAVSVFVGTARDFSRGRFVAGLEYEHYSGLAERKMGEIRREAMERFGLIQARIIHRTGPVPVGENIVLILAAAEHRGEAFEACRWCIDRLKESVPIWKKETTSEGDVWIGERP